VRVSLLSFAFCFQWKWIIWAVRGQGESWEKGVSACQTHGSLLFQVLRAFSKAFSPSGKLAYAFECLDEGMRGSV